MEASRCRQQRIYVGARASAYVVVQLQQVLVQRLSEGVGDGGAREARKRVAERGLVLHDALGEREGESQTSIGRKRQLFSDWPCSSRLASSSYASHVQSSTTARWCWVA